MAQEVPSLFTKYILTDEEEQAGIQFNTYNRFVIQNLIAEAAEEKVKLVFDPQNPQRFIQREAELQGQINILTYLLEAYEQHLRMLEAAPQEQ